MHYIKIDEVVLLYACCFVVVASLAIFIIFYCYSYLHI